MPVSAPHFLLTAQCRRRRQPGAWRFVLETADGCRQLEVEDAEPAVGGDRLELLTVVRGLEAIDRPARVTLLTGSSYIKRGLSYGLDDWRSNDWQWERHGEMVPVKNSDLWRRLDRALQFHRVECRLLRFDQAHDGPAAESSSSLPPRAKPSEAGQTQHPETRPARVATDLEIPLGTNRAGKVGVKRRDFRRLGPAIRRWLRNKRTNMRLALAQLGTDWLPKPWFE